MAVGEQEYPFLPTDRVAECRTDPIGQDSRPGRILAPIDHLDQGPTAVSTGSTDDLGPRPKHLGSRDSTHVQKPEPLDSCPRPQDLSGVDRRCLAILHAAAAFLNDYGQTKPGHGPKGDAVGTDQDRAGLSTCEPPSVGELSIG